MKLIMANSLNNVTPLFRNAILYKDKIYFCGSVTANGRVACRASMNRPDGRQL